ncbi:uncharacterized protein G2W53_021854 [Senna tora]|uniref:Uncharacterized protein n=1 Tax=Senna tora TaxID=362788 RepID=A0A834TKY5_9FABA|nr:uncharacterized protein G2W53_021854 [Senna tora]
MRWYSNDPSMGIERVVNSLMKTRMRLDVLKQGQSLER